MMKKLYGKTKISTIALVLLLTISAMLVALPAVTAQPTKTTFAVCGVTPNPVGVGQEALIWTGITDSLASTEMGWEGLTVTVVDPEGIESTIGPIRTDSTGGTGRAFTPTKVGTYTFQTHFPEQVMEEATRGFPAGTIMKASTSEKVELIVLSEPIEYYPGISLPTEYWTRPIDAQFREWSSIAGNYLDRPLNRLAPYNDNAPETAHILWEKQLAIGGLAGGIEFGPQAFECGDAYKGKFATGTRNSIIIGGVLYYNQFEAQGGSDVEQVVVAVDLHTGEELWTKSLLDPDGVSQRLSFGQVFYWDSYNYHGAFAYLWTSIGPRNGPYTWHAYDAFSGRWIYSMENVPSGTKVYGPKGGIFIYTVNTNKGWMSLWNSSRVVSDHGDWSPQGKVYENVDELGLEWNITIPEGLLGSARVVFHEDRIIGTNAPTQWDYPKPSIALWGINLKPNQEGTLLFNTTWTVPINDLLTIWGTASLEDGVFVISGKEIRGLFGFSLDTGKQLWGPTQSQPAVDMYTLGQGSGVLRALSIYDGKLLTAGYAGVVHCYDITSGKLLWTYDADDPYTEILWSNNWPLIVTIVTDGKIYVTHYEHSPLDPKPRGAPSICLDVETGDEIWRIDGAFRGTEWGGLATIGDSIIATMDTYDQRIYAIGKGPSATTIDTPLIAVPKGTGITIRGKVTDESPGTKDYALTARFPNGVPAVADEDMSDWMLYVYKQFERPDVTGVTVKLEAIDPNGNYQDLGTATTDASGNYGFTWKPTIEGQYMIMATFYGSGAYYGSTTTTYLAVGPAVSPAGPIEPEPTPPLITTEVAIILIVVALAIIGIVGYWALKKRK